MTERSIHDIAREVAKENAAQGAFLILVTEKHIRVASFNVSPADLDHGMEIAKGEIRRRAQ